MSSIKDDELKILAVDYLDDEEISCTQGRGGSRKKGVIFSGGRVQKKIIR